MGDQSNDRPRKRPRTRANASQSQAPSHSGSGVDPTLDPALTGLIAPTEEDILVQYDTVLWPATFSFRQILQPAPVASPFSLSYDEWLNNTPGDPLGSIREFFDLVFLNAPQLQEELSQRYPAFGSDSQLSGFLCWAEGTLSYDGVDQKFLNGNWVDKLGSNTLQLYFKPLSFSLKSRADIVKRDLRQEPGQSRDDWTQNLTIYGLKKKQTYVLYGGTEYSFFVVNDFDQPFSINGVPIAKGTVAGPLPDFAIIDIDGFFALWWCSEGIEYVPIRTNEVCASPSVEALDRLTLS